jgi:alkylated DNA repair dioxygenase AlkB
MALPFQMDLLGSAESPDQLLPDGARYASDVLSPQDESRGVRIISGLDLKPFAFRGYFGNRRTVSFGWHYDFQGGGLQQAAPMPPELRPYRDAAARFAGLASESLEHCLAIEYAPGAGIGWHRDRPQFGVVVALSLLAPCRMRFRRKDETGWERRSQILAPRSAYVLDGPGRSEWEHSIPRVEHLRYSLTFRTVKRSGSDV